MACRCRGQVSALGRNDELGRNERDFMAEGVQAPAPVVGAAAGFHDDLDGSTEVAEERRGLGA